jgi:hypothetical protein
MQTCAAATGLSDAFTEWADEAAAAHSHPKRRAEGAPVDPPPFIGTRPIGPICAVTDRRQVDLDGAPNGLGARSLGPDPSLSVMSSIDLAHADQ